MENAKPILVEVRTKLPLDCYVKLSAYVAERNMKRGKLFENALNDYWDLETYCLDKAELEELLANGGTADRVAELRERMYKFEKKHNIQYEVF